MNFRYAIIVFSTIGLLFLLQNVLLRQSGGRAAKSESNFFSSLARIQAGAVGNPRMMVLGSSITGRLPDRAQGIPDTANMGCDGGSALDALRAMDAGLLPTAPRLVVEANTLHLGLSAKTSEVSGAMNGFWFKAGLKCSGLAAYARPSAFLYSELLELRTGSFSDNPSDDLQVNTKPERVTSPQARIGNDEEERLIRELAGIFSRMKEKGIQITLVWLPPARKNEKPVAPWILELAARSEIPFWDLGQQANPELVKLTDSVHMDSASAARTMNSLLNAREVRDKSE
ncbi:MAG: hypothetical protein QM627_06490 [Luteolibacter sp.]